MTATYAFIGGRLILRYLGGDLLCYDLRAPRDTTR